MAQKEFEIGQKVDWVHEDVVPSRRYGVGPFVVSDVHATPDHIRKNTGHLQWVGLSKNVNIEGVDKNLVWDTGVREWVEHEELSDLGRTQPVRLCASWLRPIVEE